MGASIPYALELPLMPLTDSAIRNAKPDKKPFRMFDAGGLYLEVAPSGGKWWRFKYRIEGKEKRLSLGVYPDVPLASRTEKNKESGKPETIKGARERRDEARALLAAGIDPSAQRKADQRERRGRETNSFEHVAREWYGKQWCGSGRGTTLYYVCVWLHEGGNSFSLVDVSDEQEANL